MTALSIQPTYPIFTETDGLPLENGYIWLGTVNLNPIVNPIAAFFDAALTIPAVQPIRTLGGYPVYQGTPARIYVNSDYSIQVQNKNGSLVYSAPAATERMASNLISYAPGADSLFTATTVQGALDQISDDESGSDYVGFLQSGTNALKQTVQDKLRQYINILDFGANRSGNIAIDSTPALNAAIAAAIASQNKTVYIPSGVYYFNTLPASITSGVKIVGDGVSNTVLTRNFNAENVYDGIFNIRDGCFGCVFQDFTIIDVAGITGGCHISMYKAVADSTAAGDFTKIVNCNFTTYGTNTHYAAIYIDGEARTSGAEGVRDLVMQGCTIFGGAQASIYARVVRGFDISNTSTFQAGGTTGRILITGTVAKPSQSLNVSGFGIDGFNLTHLITANISVANCGLIANDATATNVVFIGTAPSGIQPNVVRSHYLNTAFRAEFADLYVKDGGSGSVPAGTNNTYGFYVTPGSAGFVYVDALTSSTSTSFMRLRNYSNGNYYVFLESNATGGVLFPAIGTTASAANAHLNGTNTLLKSTSSIKYKKDIEDIDEYFSKNALKLRPVWYRSKADADRQDWSWYGLIAEEVAEVDPRLVHWKFDKYIQDENEQTVPADDANLIPDGVQYERLSVLLLSLVQKQEERIVKLEEAYRKQSKAKEKSC